MTDDPQDNSGFCAVSPLERKMAALYLLIDAYESDEDEMLPYLTRYIHSYVTAEEEAAALAQMHSNPKEFIRAQVKAMFDNMSINARSGFLKSFLLGSLNEDTLSDVRALLSLGGFDADMQVNGGSLIASLADHAPLMMSFPRVNRTLTTGAELSEDQKRRLLRNIYEVLLEYGANPNGTYASAGSGDVSHALTTFELVILNEVKRKDPGGHDLVDLLKWMCKSGMELEATRPGEFTKVQQLASLVSPLNFLDDDQHYGFNQNRAKELYRTLAKAGAKLSTPYPGDRIVEEEETLKGLLSTEGKTVIEMFADYERSMEIALQNPEKFQKQLIQLQTAQQGWASEFTVDVERIEEARRYYRAVGQELKELYKEQCGVTSKSPTETFRA